ncbi:MAG TPA: PASTA domain-containing protein [bacterium]|nr:PASTA domain-containing protein [bacterium]HNT66683.1 PASTA domain-containing protein [bacterium]HOX87024.1 PASTA domain-containing protein [bacterium]HPG46355.1 PASTA domain-containing protein [bacterium]HPM98731.1 PASTA domain-containing protein [bacterium]
MKSFFRKEFFSAQNLKFAALFLAGCLLLFLLLDNLIMPLLTRHWQSVDVPNVANLSWNAAEKVLRDKGLKAVKAAEKYDREIPPGFVIFQSPEAGSPVKKGRRIYLTIGKGERIVEMPKLIGFSIRDAEFILNDYNLTLGDVTREPDDYWPEGVVSQQSVPAGHEVMDGAVIQLKVSLGNAATAFIVPRLVGRSIDDALLEIQKAGLAVGAISYQTTEELIPETVISQSLSEGQEVAKGDSINLVVCRLPHKVQ